MDEFIFEIEDYRGVKVKLARTVWQDKILSTLPIGHPEVKPYMNIIPQAIHLPDVVFQSTRRKNTHIFYKLRVDKKGHHIVIVIKYIFEDTDMVGYVSTVYLTNKLYARGDILWTLESIKTR
jgi:hypothetical protein